MLASLDISKIIKFLAYDIFFFKSSFIFLKDSSGSLENIAAHRFFLFLYKYPNFIPKDHN